MKDTLVIGKITGAHSIHGEIKIFPLTDDIGRFSSLKYFLAGGIRYTVSSTRIHKGHVLVSSPDIPDRNAAEAMAGKFAEVLREDAIPLEEGQYYIEDLKGLTIKDTSGGADAVLTDIIQSAGPVDVIEFRRDKKTYLMPYLKEYVKSVDLENGIMEADLSKGIG